MEGIPENTNRGFEVGEKVKVLRGSGEIEEGWEVITAVAPDVDPETRVTVVKDQQIKHPTLAKLREWNS